MSDSPLAIVTAFLTKPHRSYEEMVENYRAHLAEDVVWHTGTTLCTGLAASLEILARANELYGMAYWTNDILHEAAAGDLVFNERVDHVLRADHSLIIDTYVCAIFRVAGGKIVEWRDYFNPTELRAMFAQHIS